MGEIQKWISNIFEMVNDKSPTDEFLGEALGFQAIVISISIPVALQIINWVGDKYNDNEIIELFINGNSLKIFFFSLMINISLTLFSIAFNIEMKILNWIIFLILCFNIYQFSKNTTRFISFVVNPDDFLLKVLDKHVKNIWKK